MCRRESNISDLKILIVSTSYVADEARKNLVCMWAGLHNKVNPDCDVVLIDSASPFDPARFLRPYGYDHRPIGAAPEWNPEVSRRRILSFPDNIGHLNITGLDGWGRAMSKGVQIAIDGGYDYIFYNDSDALWAPPVRGVVERMRRKGINVASPLDHVYWFMSQETLFASVAYLRDIDLIGQYDWATRHQKINGPTTVPEYVFQKIFGDEFWVLPYHTFRNDMNNMSVDAVLNATHYGLHGLSHCSDPAMYTAFLKKNGIQI